MAHALYSRARAAAFLLLLVVACSQQTADPAQGPNGTRGVAAHRTPPPDPLEGRANPLISFIRTNWTNGDPNSTSGSRYSHIKIYGHNYTDMSGFSNAQTEADFIASHFDVYMWGGALIGTSARAQNPGLMWISEMTNVPYIRSNQWELQRVADWIGSEENEHGYTLDDMVMHYKYDVLRGNTPGWNPADDPDSSGCREADEGNGGDPTDPNRTAHCIDDSRVLATFPNGWIEALPGSPAYVEMTAEIAKTDWETYHFDGYHFDVVAYQPEGHTLDSTFTYEGLDEFAPDHPYILDKIYFVPWVTKEYEEISTPVSIYLSNMVKTSYACDKQYSHDMAMLYTENAFCETWMDLGDPVAPEPVVEKRASLLECPYVDWLENGKGFVFTCFNHVPNDPYRAQLFSLSMFYMVNHQLAFYYYRTHSHDTVEGEHVEDWQWNPWVQYEVGQPAVNQLGFNDFQGNANTNRFFVFQSGATYEILGREYLRADGKRVLVLAKLMAYGQTPGSMPTTFNLPHTYRRVIDGNGTLGSGITQLTLSNNEGAILLEEEAGGGGGSKRKPNG